MQIPPDDTNMVPTVQLFFAGIEYLFTDSEAPAAHRFKNHGCYGRAIVLHPDEPPDDLSQPVRVLSYHPLAIHVEPWGEPLGDVCRDAAGCPVNCIPVEPVNVSGASMTFPKTIDAGDGTTMSPDLAFTRRGFPLVLAYAVTDYFAQGMSFKGACWILHLSPPPSGHFKRPSVLVPLTRYRHWGEVRSLCPLWSQSANEEDKQAVKDKFVACARVSPDLVAEMRRLKQAAIATRASLEPRAAAVRDEIRLRRLRLASGAHANPA